MSFHRIFALIAMPFVLFTAPLAAYAGEGVDASRDTGSTTISERTDKDEEKDKDKEEDKKDDKTGGGY